MKNVDTSLLKRRVFKGVPLISGTGSGYAFHYKDALSRAFMNADSIIRNVDFVSLGTNGLQQFIAAADRESLMVSNYYEEAASKR